MTQNKFLDQIIKTRPTNKQIKTQFSKNISSLYLVSNEISEIIRTSKVMSTMWDHQVGSTYSTRLLTIKRTSKAGWKFRLCIDAAIYMNTGKRLFRIRLLLTSLSFRCILGDFPVLVLRQANKDLKWQSTSVKMTMQSQKFLIPTSHLDFLLFSIDNIYNCPEIPHGYQQ